MAHIDLPSFYEPPLPRTGSPSPRWARRLSAGISKRWCEVRISMSISDSLGDGGGIRLLIYGFVLQHSGEYLRAGQLISAGFQALDCYDDDYLSKRRFYIT